MRCLLFLFAIAQVLAFSSGPMPTPTPTPTPMDKKGCFNYYSGTCTNCSQPALCGVGHDGEQRSYSMPTWYTGNSPYCAHCSGWPTSDPVGCWDGNTCGYSSLGKPIDAECAKEHCTCVEESLCVADSPAYVECKACGADANPELKELPKMPTMAALDIVFANTGTPLRGSQVLRNDGTGKFSPVNLAGPYSTQDAYAVATADIDGDGHDELFFGYWAAGPVKMHKNNGSGVFAAPTNCPSMPCMEPCEGGEATWFNSLTAADVNQDGYPDLLAGTFGEPNFILLGGADGFAEGVPLQGGALDTYDIAVGDVNGDGFDDLVIGNGGDANQLLLGSGDGDFSLFGSLPGMCSMKAQDGSTSRQMCATRAIAVADVNGDGALDVVTANYYGENHLNLNLGSGVFGAAIVLSPGNGGYFGQGPTDDLAVCDVNNDGLLDVIFGNEGFRNQVVYNQGGGVFGIPVNLQEPPESEDCNAPVPGGGMPLADCSVTYAIACGDLNADGLNDLVVANYGQPNLVYISTGGSLNFEKPVPLPGQTGSWSADVALGKF